jgi:hypothetical protein
MNRDDAATGPQYAEISRRIEPAEVGELSMIEVGEFLEYPSGSSGGTGIAMRKK